MAIKGINYPIAPAKIDYPAWHTAKNTRRAAAKLRRFGELLDSGSIASFGGKSEAVVRDYWRREMPREKQLCNHRSRETIAGWTFEAKTEFLANWAQTKESSHLSPMPFMVMSSLAKEMGRNGGSVIPQDGLESLVKTALKPIFEAMARNLFSFAGVKETDGG